MEQQPVAIPVQAEEVQVGVLEDLRERMERGFHAARGTIAEETMRALERGARAFAAWAVQRAGRRPFPADPQAVADYVDALHSGDVLRDAPPKPRKPAGIRQAVWAIGRMHKLCDLPDPTGAEVVALAVKRAARASGGRQRQAAAIGELAAAAIRATGGSRLRDLRDTALLLVMRDLLARRSEAVALRVEDIEFDQDGTATALIRRGKTDQEGAGAVLFLGASTVSALRSWLDAAGIAEGPIFRAVNKGGRVSGDALHPAKVSPILKRLATRAGMDPAGVSGHSCRVGMAQDLMAAGADTMAIQHAGRWKTPVMPARYVERIAASRGAVARYHQRRGD